MKRQVTLQNKARMIAPLLLCLVFMLPLARPSWTQETGRSTTGKLIEATIPVPALKGNKLGDAAEQPVAVYLPPSYETSPQKRYPTLYLLHGFTGKITEWTRNGYQGMSLQPVMDGLIKSGALGEMIVVVPTGANAYGGSFYTNSTVTGNWEDYITRDLVSYIDNTYRTIAKSESRGIAGHSMGGYGSIMLAMKHPDIYSAAYALSPCCLGLEADMGAENPAWQKTLALKSQNELKKNPETFDEFWTLVFVALSAALSPNAEHSPFFADYPFRLENGRLVQNEAVYKKWLAKMPVNLVDDYKENLLKLKGLYIDYGQNEEFSHIRNASREFSRKLAERNIPHGFEIYAGGTHGNKIRERLETKVLPFFSRVLNFGS
jgi:S-formylglutathione hydrolase FrmB